MGNFWDNDEVIPVQLPQETEEEPNQINFWDKDEVVSISEEPVSENPDRQFYQSGTSMEDRVFDELPEFTVDEEESTAPLTSVRPQGRPKQGTAPSSVEVELFDKVVGGESDDYDTVYYGSKVKPPKPVTQMTVEDIRSWQDASVKAGSKSSAVGRFQIIRKTMDSLINEGVLSPTDVFNEETQKKAYTALLDRRGYSKIKAQIRASSSLTEKKKLAENLQNNLAMEFASIPVATAIPKGKFGKWPKVDLVPGDTFYKDPKNPKLNKAQHKVEDFLNILTRL